MTTDEAIKWQEVIKVVNQDRLSFNETACDMAILALRVVDSLKSELKVMKEEANGFTNWDYMTGYISAISTIEGYIAELESGGSDND